MTARVAKRASPRDLGQLRKSLAELPPLVETLKKSKVKELKASATIDLLSDMQTQLEAALVAEPPLTQKEGGIFRAGFDEELDEFVMLATDSRQMIARIEERERQATGIPNLKVAHTSFWILQAEVTRTHLSRVPDHYRRKQTIANGERYVTEELRTLEEKITWQKSKDLQRPCFLSAVRKLECKCA